MALSDELVSQFTKLMKPEEDKTQESTLYGKFVIHNGKKYVQLDGSELLTPVEQTATAKEGDRVSVTIKNHNATVTGNYSSPAARSGDVDENSKKILEVGTLLTDKASIKDLKATNATVENLVADNATIKNELKAANATIETISADNVTIKETLKANKAAIDDLDANKLSANVADLKYATIEKLEATNADIHNLSADYGEFKQATVDDLSAKNATIQKLQTEKLSATDADLRYANIDFSNIGKAAIEQFYATSGIIKDLVIGDQTITGELVGVTIKGDLIEGGTVVADKLVVKGQNGLYYKLNTDGVTTEAEQTDYNSLNGSVITAKSITASKVNVKDLVAFDATIGGFNITNKAIYSGVKDSVDNSTRGIYQDKDGQISVGDGDEYLKYFKDKDGRYKLAISAGSIKFSASNKNLETVLGDTITKTVEEFYLSSSPTSLSGGSWSTKQPTWTEGKYIWRRTAVTYGDGSSEYTPSTNGVCITGNTGAKGEKGTDGAQGIPGIDFSQGKMLFTDPMFTNGVNGISIYNNSGNGKVVCARLPKSSDNPFPDTKYEIVITNKGSASPGIGGFTFRNQSRANAVFIYRIIAKIPTDRNLRFNSNPYGNDNKFEWLTSNNGTGKFTEYVGKATCGATGTFSTTGCFYLDGSIGTETSPVKWYIAYATCFDMTNTSDVSTKATKEEVTTAVNNVQVGGRNLLYQYVRTGSRTSKIDDKSIKIGTEVGDTYFYLKTHVALVKGETYTISCDASNVPSGCNWSFGVGDQASKFQLYINKNGRCSATGILEKDVGADSEILIDDMSHRPSTALNIILSNFKLEKGNKATDWTPAPEDQVEKAKIISEINQSPEQISIKASKISLEGIVTANQKFKILEDGSMEATGGKFTGTIESSSAKITGGSIEIQTTVEKPSFISLTNLFNNTQKTTAISADGINLRNDVHGHYVSIGTPTVGSGVTNFVTIGRSDGQKDYNTLVVNSNAEIYMSDGGNPSSKQITSIKNGAIYTYGNITAGGTVSGTAISASTISASTSISAPSFNAGANVSLWTDGEGGNLAILAPNGHRYEMDAYNGSLRIYHGGGDFAITLLGSDAYTRLNHVTAGDLSVSGAINAGSVNGMYKIRCGTTVLGSDRGTGTGRVFMYKQDVINWLGMNIDPYKVIIVANNGDGNANGAHVEGVTYIPGNEYWAVVCNQSLGSSLLRINFALIYGY